MNMDEVRHWALVLMTLGVAALCWFVGGATWAAVAYLVTAMSLLFEVPGSKPAGFTALAMTLALFLAACGW